MPTFTTAASGSLPSAASSATFVRCRPIKTPGRSPSPDVIEIEKGKYEGVEDNSAFLSGPREKFEEHGGPSGPVQPQREFEDPRTAPEVPKVSRRKPVPDQTSRTELGKKDLRTSRRSGSGGRKRPDLNKELPAAPQPSFEREQRRMRNSPETKKLSSLTYQGNKKEKKETTAKSKPRKISPFLESAKKIPLRSQERSISAKIEKLWQKIDRWENRAGEWKKETVGKMRQWWRELNVPEWGVDTRYEERRRKRNEPKGYVPL
jgi:hypothetical protein